MNRPIGGVADDEVHYTTITFDRIKVQIAQMVDPDFFKSTEIAVENTVRGLMIKLHHEVFGQHNYQEYTVMQPIPANWWECFKEEHMPQWYIKRYPIKRKFARHTITFDHKELFPHARINVPDIMGDVVFHSQSSDPTVIK